MTANVPTTESGSERLGMTVAATLRRKRKITMTTRAKVRSSVNCTSTTEWRIETERSYSVWIEIEAGSWGRTCSRSPCTASATWTVLVPGWRWIASVMAR